MKVIASLAFHCCEMLDITGPMSVFAAANQQLPAPCYQLEVVGLERGEVTTDSGLGIVATRDFSDTMPIDTLLLPGGHRVQEHLSNQQITHWLQHQIPLARRTVSVCTGAYWLAELGLLDGEEATTHWRHCERFQSDYPKVRVNRDALYLHQRHTSTAAGITAGIDLALELIEQDHGAALALAVAQELLVFRRRPGGQAQFIDAQQSMDSGDPRLAHLIHYIHQHLGKRLTLDHLAECSALSVRQLTRLFRQEFAISPAKYVTQARLKKACQLLRTSDQALTSVALRCGFQSSDQLRNVFYRHYGICPSRYQQQFSGKYSA